LNIILVEKPLDGTKNREYQTSFRNLFSPFFIQLDMKNQKEAISSAFQAAIVIVSLSIGLRPAVMKSLPFRQHLSLLYWNSLSLSANRQLTIIRC